MLAAQRTVVAVVAKSVEHRSDLYTLCRFLGKQVKEAVGYRVIPKVEIFQMYGRASLLDGLK